MKLTHVHRLSLAFVLLLLYFVVLLVTLGCTNGKTHRIWVDEETYHRLRLGEKLPPRAEASPTNVSSPASGLPIAEPVRKTSEKELAREEPTPLLAPRWFDSLPPEPMWLISAFSGNRDAGNPTGAAVWWRDDDGEAVDNLLERIKEGYGNGARRFFVNRPMGTTGSSHVSGAAWLTLSDEKRLRLPSDLTDFLLDPNVEPVHIYWFIGSELRDPRDLAGWRPDLDGEMYELGEGGTFAELIGTRVTLGGYISTGASGLVIDHSSPPDERDHFVELSRSLLRDPFRMHILGEAYPTRFLADGAVERDKNGRPVLDPDYIGAMGWVGATQYVRDPSRWPLGTQTETWPPSYETTRLYEWFNYRPEHYGKTERDRRDYVRQVMRENLIPITNDPAMFDEAVQIYRLRWNNRPESE